MPKDPSLWLRQCAWRLCGWLVGLFRLFPLRKNKVLLLCNFAEWGSLGVVGQQLAALPRYKVVHCNRWHHLRTLYHLATSRYVLLNNSVRLLAFAPLHPQTRVIQLWHGEGALKKWGCSVHEDPHFRAETARYHAVICSSEAVRPFWAEAFAVPPERVFALPSPRIEALLQSNRPALRAALEQRYPQCAGKRVLLYAPTFRHNPATTNHAPLDLTTLCATLGENTQLALRLHPGRHKSYAAPAGVLDWTHEPDALPLLAAADGFVSDYSSLMLPAATLGLPVWLFAYDYENYQQNDRGFYQPLTELAPGPIAKTTAELIALLAEPWPQPNASFVQFHLGDAAAQKKA